MAYMNQEKKNALAPAIKAILKKYGVKGSISVQNYSTLVLTLKSGPIDFLESYNRVCGERYRDYGFQPVTDYMTVNEYWYDEHYDGIALEFLQEVIPAMNDGNHDNSDIQIDYFDVGWYTAIKIGKWDKCYIVTGQEVTA